MLLVDTQNHLSTAWLNGRPVSVHQANRPVGGECGPVLVTVAASVALTVDEVAAVLFDWGCGGAAPSDLAELAEDDHVRHLVAEWVVNGGCGWMRRWGARRAP